MPGARIMSPLSRLRSPPMSTSDYPSQSLHCLPLTAHCQGVRMTGHPEICLTNMWFFGTVSHTNSELWGPKYIDIINRGIKWKLKGNRFLYFIQIGTIRTIDGDKLHETYDTKTLKENL